MSGIMGMPDQLVSDATKNTKKWKEANVKALSDMVGGTANYGLRKSKEEVEDNMRMFNNSLSHEDMLDIFDPYRIAEGEVDQIPDIVKSYNVVRGPLITIAAEQRKRKLEYSATAINSDVVNAKDTEFKNKLFGYFAELEQKIMDGEYVDEAVVQSRLESLQLAKTNSIKTAHEAMANELMQYFQNDPNIRLAYTFGKGFHWLLIAGEVCYRVYSVGKDIKVAAVDLRNFYTFGMGDEFHENAEAWVEREYLSLAQLTSEFKLTKAEIKKLEELRDGTGNASMYQQFDGDITGGSFVGTVGFGEDLELSPAHDEQGPVNQFMYEARGEGEGVDNQYVTSDGRIQIDRVHWVSKRKVYEVENPEDGAISYEDESYEAPENSGEVLEEVIFNEMWQGVHIGGIIIKDVKPCDMQLRSVDNPAIVRPPYVGAILNYATNEKAVSILDDIRSYKEDYDMWANKLRKLWITYQGAVMRIDRSRIPDSMTPKEWFKWYKTDNISWEDSFRTSPDGAFLAGNMQAANPIIQPSIYNEIIAATQTLDRLENKIKEMAAMPPARSGELQGNEGLGVSQQAMITAGHRTEDSFILHNYVNARVLEVMIEYTKYLWDDEEAVRKQYLLSDLGQYMLEYDAKLMQEAEVSVMVTDSSKMAEFEREISPIAQAQAQNNMINLSDYAKYRNAPTPSMAVKILELSEQKKRAQDAEQAKLQGEEQRKTLEMQAKMAEEAHKRELELITIKAQQDRQTKLEVAQMQIGGGMLSQQMADENGDGVVDGVELEAAEIAARSAEEIKRMDVEAKERMHQKDIDIEVEKNRLKEEELKVKRMQINKTSK